MKTNKNKKKLKNKNSQNKKPSLSLKNATLDVEYYAVRIPLPECCLSPFGVSAFHFLRKTLLSQC